jgi:hypothetical protein
VGFFFSVVIRGEHAPMSSCISLFSVIEFKNSLDIHAVSPSFCIAAVNFPKSKSLENPRLLLFCTHVRIARIGVVDSMGYGFSVGRGGLHSYLLYLCTRAYIRRQLAHRCR